VTCTRQRVQVAADRPPAVQHRLDQHSPGPAERVEHAAARLAERVHQPAGRDGVHPRRVRVEAVDVVAGRVVLVVRRRGHLERVGERPRGVGVAGRLGVAADVRQGPSPAIGSGIVVHVDSIQWLGERIEPGDTFPRPPTCSEAIRTG